MNELKKSKINFLKNNLIFLIIFASLFICINSQNNNKKNRNFFYSNEITIKIKGNGSQNILHSNFNPPPDQILIEGVLYQIKYQNILSNLENSENNITMIWNNIIDNCEECFMD